MSNILKDREEAKKDKSNVEKERRGDEMLQN